MIVRAGARSIGVTGDQTSDGEPCVRREHQRGMRPHECPFIRVMARVVEIPYARNRVHREQPAQCGGDGNMRGLYPTGRRLRVRNQLVAEPILGREERQFDVTSPTVKPKSAIIPVAVFDRALASRNRVHVRETGPRYREPRIDRVPTVPGCSRVRRCGCCFAADRIHPPRRIRVNGRVRPRGQ